MPERVTQLDAVRKALAACAGDGPFPVGAAELLGALGYHSELTETLGGVAEFVDWLDQAQPLTDRQRQLFDSWRATDIVFQFTDDEIGALGQGGLFAGAFDRGRAKSFLFVAVELESSQYSRTELAAMTRVVNRRLPMPVILLFRHGGTVTLAAVHRRAHKRDDLRDVLERVTLIKDIRTAQPHRAHLDILLDLALPAFIEGGVGTFDDLHVAWERVLDIEALNRRFYRELFEWFKRAAAECTFPDDGAGDGAAERHVIRLITRLLFIWFLKEKELVPEGLFDEGFARTTLTNHASDRSDYYRAVLQNLFFATLNTPIERRGFSRRSQRTHRDFSRYRYRDLLADPAGFKSYLATVPFVNGGLFDCLDDFASRTAGGRRVDVFTDNETQRADLSVPARLFFDHGGLFPLFRKYKFTVEENTPIDQEVALDPELLGRVFEHLLAAYNPETRETARRTTGSYYTPRKVVDYMVHEALVESLASSAQSADGDRQWRRERIDYLLDQSDAMDDAEELFNDAERKALVAAIAQIKVLDPAVGSGAFPMAILSALTLALRRLDADNALWEGLQKQRATSRAAAAFDTRDQPQRDAELAEISAIFERYRRSDFGRKLYLIQNSIFGVDIQPIACQIARLRFFISLVIEQTTDFGADNLGIKPLPNLETRFVAADALLALERPAQLGLISETASQLHRDLQANRERHFHAGDRNTKLALRETDSELRSELAAELESLGFPTDAAAKVAAWDPYDQNASADWFDAEYMFGVTDGFHVVIGNPPYIQLQRAAGRVGNRYANAGFATFNKTGDIYQLFCERGGNLLKPADGMLAYITSNSWLKAEYGAALRCWFATLHTPLRLIEMGKDVFDAIVDAAVVVVRQGGSGGAFPAVDVDRAGADDFPPAAEGWGEARPGGAAPWRILSAVEWRVLDKMRTVGKPLKDWDVRVNYGIKTGCNAAFILDSETRDGLIASDPRSAEIIKPVLRGRDIERWRTQSAGKWLVDTHNGYAGVPAIDIADFPAVKRHLDQFYPMLQKRQDKGDTPYNLRHCAYHQDFRRQKLFWMDLTDRGRFAYASDEVFALNTVYFLIGGPVKFLCAVLNSRLVTWFMNHGGLTSGMGVTRWFSTTVSRVPVPVTTPERQGPLVQLVDEILAAKDADPEADVTALENEIDRLVYALYGLVDEEVGAVEGVQES